LNAPWQSGDAGPRTSIARLLPHRIVHVKLDEVSRRLALIGKQQIDLRQVLVAPPGRDRRPRGTPSGGSADRDAELRYRYRMRGARRALHPDPFASFNLYGAFMILEMASLEIDPSQAEPFEAAVRQALPLFARARGCGGAELHRVIERSGGYLLVVKWDTVDDHMVHFRQSDDFKAWRQLAGPFFKSPPQVVHTEVAVK